MTKRKRKHGRKPPARVSSRGNRRVGGRKADRVAPSGGTAHVVTNGRGFVPSGSTLSGSTPVVAPKPDAYKPSIFRPPPGQMVVILTIPGNVENRTLWYVGRGTEFEYNTSAIPFRSWGEAVPRQYAGEPEITIRGFKPEFSGNEPLKSKKWPTHPPKPQPKPPKPIEKYTSNELADAIDEVADRLKRLNEEQQENYSGAVEDELKGARERFSALLAELRRRPTPRAKKAAV